MDPNHETLNTLRVQKCFIQCLGSNLCSQVTSWNLANLILDLKWRHYMGNQVCKCFFFNYRGALDYNCRSRRNRKCITCVKACACVYMQCSHLCTFSCGCTKHHSCCKDLTVLTDNQGNHVLWEPEDGANLQHVCIFSFVMWWQQHSDTG